ncbi:hypothetical protein RCL_jg16443.t1 [Rhizophagus clarus]|uniref:Uncharacterized protein n=1 Tax=Rhizophagus clarus TaxID=94130 RepID=A0A8H3M3E0_9GLOM|nr:hypothetical protein RCL_jg16443.t1 [Rhizophagus clarus]
MKIDEIIPILYRSATNLSESFLRQNSLVVSVETTIISNNLTYKKHCFGKRLRLPRRCKHHRSEITIYINFNNEKNIDNKSSGKEQRKRESQNSRYFHAFNRELGKYNWCHFYNFSEVLSKKNKLLNKYAIRNFSETLQRYQSC